MTTTEKTSITVQTTINAPVEKVWEFFTDPKHIVRWNNASDDWHTPRAENDLQVGGRFLYRMEAKDGSMGFDFDGEYTKVEKYREIEYKLGDGRRVNLSFAGTGSETKVTETFDAEETHSIEMQQQGWQSILDNFKKYVEDASKLQPIHLEITINAPAEKAYQMMLDENYYKEWTEPFNPGSHFIGSWEKGSAIRFIGCDKDGNMGGMVSRIKENIPNQFVSIEHLGIIQGDQEITSGPEVDGWAGALENYTFKEENGKTLLSVDMDANQEFLSYFEETWPKALNKLKAICEANNN
jgi:uncharacterized protein YndB with AHSA1/START domain